MEGLKKDIRLMRAVIILIALSSFSLIFAAFDDYFESALRAVAMIAAGSVFWICLIAGYSILFLISKHRKEYERTVSRDGVRSDRRRRSSSSKRPGIITFFSGTPATVVDAAMILFLILTLVFAFIPGFDQTVLIILISILVFLVQMHCILNGVNFKYIQTVS